MSQKPSIGRVVHYRTTEKDEEIMKTYQQLYGCNIQSTLPAVIVGLNDDDGDTVNVKVMLDGNAPDLWVTSIQQGLEPGQWHWPPRV